MKILHHATTNGQQTSTSARWQPGDAIPRRGSGIEPNAMEALARNADAFALHEATRQNKVLLFNRKAGAPPAIIRGGGLEAA